MKFISYDLKNAKVRESRYWLPTYLKDHGVEQVYDFPDNEQYIVDVNDAGFYWFVKGIDHVNKKMLQDVRDKKALMIINYDHYTFGSTPVHQRNSSLNIVKFLEAFCGIFKIDAANILYLDSNYRIESLLKKHQFNGYWFNLWEYFLETIDNPSEVIEQITNKEIREKKFLYFGGKARDYRLRFLNSCFKIENFQNESFVSTSQGYFIDTETKQPRWMQTHILDLPNIVGGIEQQYTEYVTKYYHVNSYINIVAMSYFYMSHDQLEINEKLFKPIAALQPFIILGQPRTLEALKDLGYKTFDKWIDESYDSTLDDNERYDKILKEVTRLSKLTNTELSDMLYDMLPILIHNFELKKQRTRTHNPELLLNKIVSMFNHNN